MRGADKNVVVKIPDHRLPRNEIGKQVIRSAIAVKVGCPNQCITTWNRRPTGACDVRYS